MELRCCIPVALFYSPALNIAPHISLHDLPYHSTIRKCSRQVSPNKVAFLQILQRFWIQTYFYNCPQYLCLLDILVEYNPDRHGEGMMSGLPNQRLSGVFSTLGRCSVSFQASFISSTYTDKNLLFHDYQICIHNLEPFPNRVPIELSRSAFPIIVLPEDDRTDSVQGERLGLRCWPMTLAICVSVDVSKYLDILTLAFSITMVHHPF